jgi:WD40 repeat protein
VGRSYRSSTADAQGPHALGQRHRLLPDGKQLALASDDRTVRLWDAATGAALQTLKGHTRWVRAVAFSPDGKQLASASRDMTVRLWDAATGAALQTLEGYTSLVDTMVFSPDGLYLETNKGLINISSLSPSAIPPQLNPRRGIFVNEQWVAQGLENFLWLPSEYRAKCVAARGSILVLGHAYDGYDRITFFEFDLASIHLCEESKIDITSSGQSTIC